jgi:hypothetical protein
MKNMEKYTLQGEKRDKKKKRKSIGRISVKQSTYCTVVIRVSAI